MKFYSRYDRSEKLAFSTSGKSRVRQSEKDTCDVNKIMERFNRTGQLPIVQRVPPQYGDARAVDFQTAQQIVKDAQDSFNKLPSKVREHFGHSPQNYLKGISDTSEDNQKVLHKLGILVEREPTEKDLLKEVVKNTKKVEKDLEKKPGNSNPT